MVVEFGRWHSDWEIADWTVAATSLGRNQAK